MIIDISIDRKGKKVRIVDSQVFVNEQPTTVHALREVLSAPLVVKLFELGIDQLEKLPKSFLKNISFEDLITKSNSLLATKNTLETLRRLNTSHYSKTAEKASERLHDLLRNIFWSRDFKASKPQSLVLKEINQRYLGGYLSSSDFEQLYDPKNDDDSKAKALLDVVTQFPFEKYISGEAATSIRDEAIKDYARFQKTIETFLKVKKIAGPDLVNWGPHKFTSQGKKHKFRACWTVRDWAEKLSRHMIKTGAPVTKRKVPHSKKLKTRWQNGEELTQGELITVFKNEGDANAYQVVADMTAEGASALLEINTKNVRKKLFEKSSYYSDRIDSKDALQMIVKRIAEGDNPKAFGALKTFFEKNNVSYVTWGLLKKYAGHYSTDDFLKWTKSQRLSGDPQMDDAFFDKVLSKLPADSQLKIHDSVTNVFLERMNTSQKAEFLHSYRTVPKVLKRLGHDPLFAHVDWGKVAPLFKSVPYKNVLEFIVETDANGETRLPKEFDYFISTIVKNKDAETAMLALKQGRYDGHRGYGERPNKYCEGLFEFLNYNQKLEVLREGKGGYWSGFEPKKIFKDKTELKNFSKLVLEDTDLWTYQKDIPLTDINENISKIKGQFHLLLEEKVLKALDHASTVKALKCGAFDTANTHHSYDNISYDNIKTKLYSKITRTDFDMIFGEDAIVYHRDARSLIGLMTSKEIMQKCDEDRGFFRKHVSRVPMKYLEKFKNKKALKELVGDRRTRSNDRFATAIEERNGQ